VHQGTQRQIDRLQRPVRLERIVCKPEAKMPRSAGGKLGAFWTYKNL